MFGKAERTYDGPKEMDPKAPEKQGEVEGMEGDGFPVLRRNVAGADFGSEPHWICAPTLDGTIP